MSEDKAVAWLREQVQARLDAAQALAAGGRGEWDRICNGDFDYTVYPRADTNAPDPVADTWREDVTEFIALNDPQDVIARCEAELAILDAYRLTAEKYASKVTMRDLAEDRHLAGQVFGLKTAVEGVASGYRHRPGYGEYWGEAVSS